MVADCAQQPIFVPRRHQDPSGRPKPYLRAPLYRAGWSSSQRHRWLARKHKSPDPRAEGRQVPRLGAATLVSFQRLMVLDLQARHKLEIRFRAALHWLQDFVWFSRFGGGVGRARFDLVVAPVWQAPKRAPFPARAMP